MYRSRASGAEGIDVAKKKRESKMVGILREAVESSPLTLLELGQRAGLDAGQLSRFLSGKRSLSLDAGARLCEVLGLELTWREGREPAARVEPRRGPGRPPKAPAESAERSRARAPKARRKK
jgi:transcriptional regulator with XRE-family HTH domain